MPVSVGCDPEFTVLDPNGLPVPAHSVGIKTKGPGAIKTYTSTAFRDGYNVEVNINGGKFCRAHVLDSVGNAVKFIRDFLPKGYTLTAKAAYRIRVEEQMKDAPPDVTEFGCSPSKDAYTGEDKVVVLKAYEHPWRYAGGHLHFGDQPYGYNRDGMYGEDYCHAISDRSKNPLLVKLFDRYIGVPLAVLFDDDAQWERRKYYGQAGEYREQTYNTGEDVVSGVEYRVPPPETFNHKALISLFTGVGRCVVTRFEELSKLYDPAHDDAVIRAINTGEGAKDLLLTLDKWYAPETILALKEREEIRRFQCDENLEGHTGWNDYAIVWGLPGIKFQRTI